MQNISRLLVALTGEIHHRAIVGLLAVLVLLVHFWVVILLLKPTDNEKPIKPKILMEVALVKEKKKKNEKVRGKRPNDYIRNHTANTESYTY